jgi:hypothetical protein
MFPTIGVFRVTYPPERLSRTISAGLPATLRQQILQLVQVSAVQQGQDAVA